MLEPKPKLVTKRRAYVPILSKTERLAYVAAHRILSERAYTDRLATPGGRRTAIVDGMAKIIIETFGKSKES
jgi:hypothetical protein